jgi:hypothetical protein
MFAWFIGHQLAVLFSQNKPASSTFLSEQSAPAASQTNRPRDDGWIPSELLPSLLGLPGQAVQQRARDSVYIHLMWRSHAAAPGPRPACMIPATKPSAFDVGVGLLSGIISYSIYIIYAKASMHHVLHVSGYPLVQPD